MALHTTFEKRIYSLPDGNYNGIIKNISISKDHERIFTSIEVEESNEVLRSSYQAMLCENHPITEVIKSLGVKEKDINNFDLETLIGKRVSFETYTVEKNGHQFCNVRSITILN